MQRIWNYDKIKIYLSGVTQDGDPGFTGVGYNDNVSPRRCVEWEAFPSPKGYRIDTRDIDSNAERTVYQTATWNLALEVAKAIVEL